MLPELREQVWQANQAIFRAGLVTLSFGNASGADPSAGVFLIKPSGVPYDQLRPEHLVAVFDRRGRPYGPQSGNPADRPVPARSPLPAQARTRRRLRSGRERAGITKA
jgi:ribulose-5-phosphate 4-epimerase/fuculose-1-phosphate aldolase